MRWTRAGCDTGTWAGFFAQSRCVTDFVPFLHLLSPFLIPQKLHYLAGIVISLKSGIEVVDVDSNADSARIAIAKEGSADDADEHRCF